MNETKQIRMECNTISGLNFKNGSKQIGINSNSQI